MLPEEEEEALGLPTFELLVRNGEPVVSGSYFLQPPLRATSADRDAEDASRLIVRADDGSTWLATDVPTTGLATIVLKPVGDHPALARARAISELAAENDG
jgi:hypothetical protein